MLCTLLLGLELFETAYPPSNLCCLSFVSVPHDAHQCKGPSCAEGMLFMPQQALLPGDCELQQLLHTFQLLGTPTEET